MFRPAYIKKSRHLLRYAHKLVRYKEDLNPAACAEVKAGMAALQTALAARDRERVHLEAEQLEKKLAALSGHGAETNWRESCEAIVVVLIVVIALKTYFVQQYKIPTGSMQPTLNGIIGHRAFVANETEIAVERKAQYEKRSDGWYWKSYPADGAKPNFLRQVAEFVVLGRNYINVVADEDDIVDQVIPKKYAFFFTFSEIVGQKKSYLVYAPPDVLRQDFRVFSGARYRKGDVIARGAVDTGDQVFVDKVSYNFVRPHRGDVFVFRTNDIPDIPPDPATGEHFFYIKRLAGLPGDTLSITPPLLYVDGHIAEGFGFARVMAAKPPYHGYTAGREYLSDPTKTFTVPPHSYFAMGDNSAHSSDSRYWGTVPEPNLIGRGLFVYWPFTWHWGVIR